MKKLICSYCGKVLGDSDTKFDSHGICLKCETKIRKKWGLKEKETKDE